MKIKIILILLIFSIVNFGQYEILPAQNSEKTYQSIQDDIEIMETILDKMFGKQRRGLWSFHERTSGYYLEDYGVLFKVPYSLSTISDFGKLEDAYKLAIENYRLITSIKNKKKKAENKVEIDIKEDFEKETAKIKETLARFLGDYASAMNYMQPNHWVTVIVDLNGSVEIFSEFYKNKRVHQLVAKARMKDITAYRKGVINFETFKGKIHYTSKSDDEYSSMDEDIGIFSDIMESYFERNEKRKEFDILDDINGLYLAGYGAIFMLNANVEPNVISIMTKSDGDKEFSFNTVTTSRDVKKLNQKIELLENRIINLVSRYGHTLRRLRDDESLEIALDINAHELDENYSKMIFKIQKKYIDNFNRQKMNLDELKQRIRVIKY